ncbi:MAG: DUF11 domain-containing protein [Anaerolineales bacterium]|nr:MAG: DUF11 domain-containing protein [Anaerolineales bacterium]
MKKSNLSHQTHLLRILAILCLLSSYLWIAPSQVHASSAGSQDDVLGKDQTYMTGETTADNQMVYYDHWKDGYEVGLLNPVQLTTEIYGDGDTSSGGTQTQPQTFELSLAEHLWPTTPVQTDNFPPLVPGESNPSAPLRQPTTLAVDIISSPWATVDSNPNPPGDDVPSVFVVQAVITNTGTSTATDVNINLDYGDLDGNWMLLDGEDPERTVDEVAPEAAYHAYWLATYPVTPSLSHQYTITAYADNASPVATSDNYYGNPAPDKTVQTRDTLSTGNSGVSQTSSDIVVGVAFTVTVKYDLGSNPGEAIFSPVGNLDFDPSAYRLMATEADLYSIDAEGNRVSDLLTATDRLYLPLPDWPGTNVGADVTYTFLALRPENTRLCPYTAVQKDTAKPKYDQFFCDEDYVVPITGTLTFSLTKQASSSTIQQNQPLTYTLHYTNTGDLPLSYVWIWDDVDTDIGSIIATSIDPSSDPDETTDSRVAWYLDTVPASGQPGSTGTRTFTILIDGNNQYLADHPLLVNHGFLGINPGSLPQNAALTSTVTTTMQVPVLGFTKTAEDVNGPPLVVSETIRYTLQVTNTGNYTAYNVTVTDDLPDQVTCQAVSGDSAPGCADPLVWEVSSLAPDDSASLVITVTINPGTEGQTITNTGSVTSSNVFDPPDDPPPICPDGSEPDPVSGECETTPEPLDTELSITKTAEDVNGGYLVVGDEVFYTWQVTNTGTYTAYDVTVTDDLPNQVACTGVSGDSAPAGCDDPLEWSIPSLAVDDIASLYITVTINPDSEGQTITNTGSVTSSNVPDPPDDPDPVCPDGSPPDPVSGECSAVPVQSADLAVNKGVDDAAPDEGDTIVYTISVTNNGPNDTTGVVISDALPGGVTYVTSSATQGSYNDGTGLWTVGTLHDSDVVILTITATVDEGTAGQTITNVAEISASDQLDSDSGNNSDSVNITAPGAGGVYLPIILKNY